LKNHNLAIARNFTSPLLTVKHCWGCRAPSKLFAVELRAVYGGGGGGGGGEEGSLATPLLYTKSKTKF